MSIDPYRIKRVLLQGVFAHEKAEGSGYRVDYLAVGRCRLEVPLFGYTECVDSSPAEVLFSLLFRSTVNPST